MPPEARNAGHAFALVVADELARHGVRDAVVAPGSRSTPVALALADHPSIRLHVRIDERSASYLAIGLIRATGRPVPVLCTSGTATAHLHAAAMEADQSRLPLLLLTADRPPELRGVGANQTVDQASLYGTAVRWAVDVGTPEARPDAVRYWRSLVSRAIAVAAGTAGGPAGPVHLNLPLREPLVPVDDGAGFPYDLAGRAGDQPWTAAARAPAPLPDEVAERLATASTGVLVAGAGLTPADVDGLLAYARRRDWPVIAEPHSGARRSELALRATEPVLRHPGFTATARPDVVVACGRIGLSRAVTGWLGRAPLVVLDRDGSWWDPTRDADTVVRADVAALGAAPGDAAADWSARWCEAGRLAASAVDAVLDETDALTEPLVAREVAACVGAGGALVVASSMPIRDLDLTMRPRADLAVFANRGVSGIDGFVSTAVGIALGHPGQTVALAGDLSLLHDVNGLQLDRAVDLPIVVVNNDGGGIFSLLPAAEAVDGATFERLFGTPHGVDFTAVAAAYGAGHRRVAQREELTAAVTAGTGLRLVEVRTDRLENAQLHARLRTAAAAALDAAFGSG